jgi:2-polyprenyl-6-methoxyphenol hydroxylase-like FAD-dependent oxidoreductase
VHFDRAVTEFHDLGRRGVAVTFADGGTAHGAVLIGADGVHSAVRRQLMPHAQAADSGVRAVLGRTVLTERLAELVPGAGTLVKSSPAPLLLTAMRFPRPPDAAAAASPLEVTLPPTPDYLRWVMLLPPVTPTGCSPTHRTPQSLALSVTVGWHPDLRAVIEQTDPDDISLLTLRTYVPEQRWPTGRVTLIGDAAHAAAPTTGNGANTALRDAAALARGLALAARGETTLAEAIELYETAMFDYGRMAVDESLALLRPFR